jgi:hypothetical protein
VPGEGNTRRVMTASVSVRREEGGAAWSETTPSATVAALGKRAAPAGPGPQPHAYVPFAQLTYLQQEYSLGMQWFFKMMMRDAVAAYLEGDLDFIESMVSGAGPGNPVQALGVDLPPMPTVRVDILARPAQTPDEEKSLAQMVTAIFDQCYQGPAAKHPHPQALKGWKAWLDFVWTGPTFESTMIRQGAR